MKAICSAPTAPESLTAVIPWRGLRSLGYTDVPGPHYKGGVLAVIPWRGLRSLGSMCRVIRSRRSIVGSNPLAGIEVVGISKC